jgi:uncharacterized membrane protein YqjE
MDSPKESRQGLVRSIRRVWAHLLEGLLHRFDLLAIELKEEKNRLFGLLFAGVLVSLLVFMAFLVLNMTIVAVAWEHRVLVLLVMFAIYLSLAVGLGLGLWHRLRSAPAPFTATVEELKKDRAAFFSD